MKNLLLLMTLIFSGFLAQANSPVIDCKTMLTSSADRGQHIGIFSDGESLTAFIYNIPPLAPGNQGEKLMAQILVEYVPSQNKSVLQIQATNSSGKVFALTILGNIDGQHRRALLHDVRLEDGSEITNQDMICTVGNQTLIDRPS